MVYVYECNAGKQNSGLKSSGVHVCLALDFAGVALTAVIFKFCQLVLMSSLLYVALHFFNNFQTIRILMWSEEALMNLYVLVTSVRFYW